MAWRDVVATGLLLAVAPGAGAAAAQGPTILKAEAGKPVLVGYYSFVRSDCTGGAELRIRVTIAPQHGQITVKPAVLATQKLERCGTVKAPALIVSYKGAGNYAGPDAVAFEIVNVDTGKATALSFTIGVTVPNTSL